MPVGRFKTFTVVPYLPERLSALRIVAYNLWWCWHHEAIALFRRIDDELFETLEHSPVKLLGAIDQSRLIALCHDAGFIAHLDRVERALVDYMTAPTWFQQTYHDPHFRIAYFSAEFGIHESVPIYSGGLGVLAGDHLKSASDLGLPLTGVSLMYRQGYFRQYLNLDGWQQELYPENDFYNLPLISEQGADGQPLMVSVAFPGREVYARVWRLQVGRVSLFLLDTNVPRNRPEDREITAQLYGGDQEMRIKQEMILGIGGYRALRALNQTPTVCHMNEGHSAFLALERIRYLMGQSNLSFQEAQEVIAAGNAFTTHTPVPAGNDRFPPHLIEHYLNWYTSAFKVSMKEIMALGRENPSDNNEFFCMTVLALKLANTSNGVSKLHGKVSRKMWRNLWPELPETEIPVTAIVNGIHLGGWMSQEIHHLLERYLGVAFTEKPSDPKVWQRVESIPDAEMWRAHERNREQLVVYARRKLKAQLQRRGASIHEIAKADEVLDPETLTIGFARRSATYKRGTLIFRDLDRLNKILNSKDRPVQLLFAGKAHPHDKAGKELIQRMAQVAKMPEYRRRIVFLEDYDINVARHLVHGVDVWLNNPRRPLEASGTSGMKVTANGGLHWSILDGWWAEGYDQENGFAIGAGEEYTDLAYQDEVESRALYEALEKEIVPLYYNRSEDGVPRGWMRVVKKSMMTLSPVFNTNRMVEQYMRNCYWPSRERYLQLTADNLQPAKQLAEWRAKVQRHWPQVRVDKMDASGVDRITVGREVTVKAMVNLGGLAPEDVEVQLYHGTVDSLGAIPAPETTVMEDGKPGDNSRHAYQGTFTCRSAGQYGYVVRIMPKHQLLGSVFTTGLVSWGE
jgi:glycogen phosphorylase